MPGGQPRLSVIVAGSRPEGPPPRLLAALAEGVASGATEVLIATATPASSSFPVRPGVAVVRLPRGSTVPRLRAAGLAAARAPIAALTEDFCVPGPGWAEALLAAHGRVDAVAVGGPIDRLAGDGVDWALSFQEYGRFFRRAPEGPVADLPGINVSYKRERLRAVLGGLPDEIEEIAVHSRLRTAGETLWREPEALVYDTNRRSLADSLASLFHHGRLYGGSRTRGDAVTARLLRLLASPLVPAVQLARIVPAVLAAGRGRRLLRSLPALAVLLVAWAAGEATGYALGEGASRERWV